MPDRILIVRLGALGDIIHALPAAVALREAYPSARIDWLVSARHRAILELVGPTHPGGPATIDGRIVLERRKDRLGLSVEERRQRAASILATWTRGTDDEARPGESHDERALVLAEAVGVMRHAGYDIALDLQGLMKSAVLARSSGAARVVGFAAPHLRERWAHLFYTETVEPSPGVHVIDKNLALLQAVGLRDVPKKMPVLGDPRLPGAKPPSPPASASLAEARTASSASGGGTFGLSDYVVVNPGAGWPNKRWPPEWFGDLARRIRASCGLRSVVLWGPSEESMARLVVAASGGAADLAPPTGIGEMIELIRSASLFISGDTGPLHIAAAVGTPVVGIYGPTNPARNGPWDAADVCVSRFDTCQCHHRRRCRREVCCLLDVSVADVMTAVERRLGAVPSHG